MATEGNTMRNALVSMLIISVGGVIGFFLGGTLAANMVSGNDLSAATTVALSAIGSGILGAALGLLIASRRNN